MRTVMIGLALLAGSCASVPAPPAGTDADTAAWWSITGDLSSDAMEGRDTGSPGYDRAAKYVADRFAALGLKPAGENGGWYQTVPLQEVRVEKDGTFFRLKSYPTGNSFELKMMSSLEFLHDITVRPSWSLESSIDHELAFRGYCSPEEMTNVQYKVVICFGARRAGMTTGAQRLEAAAKAGAVAVINVDDPGFTIEPSRWPEAYARSISFRGPSTMAYPEMPVMRLSANALETVLLGADVDAEALLRAGVKSEALKSFNLPTTLTANFSQSTHELQSDNVLAILPGTDPVLKNEYVIVSAHLDGYGYGEPVNGDGL